MLLGVKMTTSVPNVESVEWLNDLVAQMWPYIGAFVEKTVKENVEPMVKDLLPGPLKALEFTRVSLGSKPVRVERVDVHTRSGDTIKLDLDIKYDGDSDIQLKVGRLASLGVKTVALDGRLSCVLRPLVPVMPLVAAVQVAFISRPHISLDFTGALDIADLTVIDETVRKW